MIHILLNPLCFNRADQKSKETGGETGRNIAELSAVVHSKRRDTGGDSRQGRQQTRVTRIAAAVLVALVALPVMVQAQTCNGLEVTVDLNLGQTPGPLDDVVMGTPGNDDIRGRAGNDTICGMGGDDFIHGNSGDDWIDGGDGKDNIRGGQGGDTIFTGAGATVGTGSSAFGGNGIDHITGGPDADDLRGGRGTDVIEGAGGDDELRGNADDDFLSGQAGNDTLLGGQGNDLLNGGGGNDDLNGGADIDDCDGAEGSNTLVHCEEDPVDPDLVACDAPPAQVKEALLAAVNILRSTPTFCPNENGGQGTQHPAQHALTLNQPLVDAAQTHSNDMATNNFLSHTGSDGSSYGGRALAAGYNDNYPFSSTPFPTYEVLAAGSGTVGGAIAQWVGSTAGHCSALMRLETDEMGGACAHDANAQYTNYWTIVGGCSDTECLGW